MNRENYLKKMSACREKNVIKVLYGMKGVGKSTLLVLFAQRLIDEGTPEENILIVDFDELAPGEVLDYAAMHDYIETMLKSGGEIYLFLDELPDATAFEGIVGSLYLNRRLNIYIASSRLSLTSIDMATVLSGGCAKIAVTPVIFGEADYPNDAQGVALSLLPRIAETKNDSRFAREYTENLLAAVLLRDIIMRRQLRDAQLLYDLIALTVSHADKTLSGAKAAAILKKSAHTTGEYLAALCDSFILYPVAAIEADTGKILRQTVKYYAADTGFAQFLSDGKTKETNSAILENAVFLKLLRDGERVCRGRVGRHDIDFVAFAPDPFYVQIADEKLLAKKMRPLLAIRDQYPKFVLTTEDAPPSNYKGIKIMSVKNFLRENFW